MPKLLITPDIINFARDKGLKVQDAIETVYEAEISDMKKANHRLEDFSGLQMALFSAGLNKHSKIRDFYETTDSGILFPAIIDSRLAETVSKQPLIQYLVGSEQMIDATSVKALTLDLTETTNKKALEKRDVVEGSDLPVVSIKVGEKAISLYKRGVAIEATYEALRHTPLDMFMKTTDAIAANVGMQQIKSIIEVLVDGDGNKNALKINTTTSTPAAIKREDILNLALEFYDLTGGMMLDTILCSKELYLPINNLLMNINEMQKYNPNAAFNFPQAVFSNINVIYDSNVPQSGGKELLMGLNSANAITKYTENGSIINEIASNIRNQTRLGTLSETVGFAKFVNAASIGLKFA